LFCVRIKCFMVFAEFFLCHNGAAVPVKKNFSLKKVHVPGLLQ